MPDPARQPFHWKILRAINGLHFSLGLPLIARLPAAAGIRLARMFGRLHHRLDLDWRTVALCTHFVRERTAQALAQINPAGAPAEQGRAAPAPDRRVRQRFEIAVREELEAHWFINQRIRSTHCRFIGFEPVRALQRSGQGIVFLTFHYDAPLVGVVHMGRAGIPLNLMTSSQVELDCVPRSVQHYFRNKYAAIQQHLNGGRTLHAETHLKSFYTGLRKGCSAVILGEAPAAQDEDGIVVRFMHRRRAFAPGAVRLAERTRSPLVPFVCECTGAGQYRIEFGAPLLPTADGSHAANQQALYEFIEKRIQAHPEKWWAADLLPSFRQLD